MKKEIFLHVGLAKTGTKFLQLNFFPKLKGLEYIPKPLYYKSIQIIEKSKSKRFLVSQEYDQQFEREIRKWAKFDPSIKVIIVFRSQDSWFASEYRRFVKNGFRGSIEEFIDLEHDGGYFKIKDGMYIPKIQIVEQLFENPPFVLLYDELRHDPVRFLHKLAIFMDVDFSLDSISFAPRHTSYAEKQLKVMLVLGRYFGVAIKPLNEQNRFIRFWQRLWYMLPRYFVLYSARLFPNFLLNKEPLIPEKYLKKIKEFYQQDWKQTKEYAKKIQEYYLKTKII